MRLKLQPAASEDAESIAALRNAVSDDLTFRYGKGSWTHYCTTAGVLQDMPNGNLFVALQRGEAVASFNLAAKKPGAINLEYFTKVERPLYLLSMVVAPERQRQGCGRACFDEALKFARRRKAGALFLDAFDHAAGAGEFYRKCGCREVARASCKGAPLIYFERVL